MCQVLDALPSLPTSGTGLPTPSRCPAPCCRPSLSHSGVGAQRVAFGPPVGPPCGSCPRIYDPYAGQPPRAGAGDPMITRRTKSSSWSSPLITLLGVSSSAPTMPGWTGWSSTTPTPSSRTSRTPAGSSSAAWSPTAGSGGQGRAAGLTDAVRRRLPRHRARRRRRSRPTPWPWSGTAPPSASSTSSCSPGPTRAVPRGALEIALEDTRTPIADRAVARPTSPTTVESVDKDSLATTVDRARARVQRHRRGPPADHRHRQLVHRRGQRQLRRHHCADPRQQHGAASGQFDTASAIRTFARDLRLFSGTLAGPDKDLREVIDHGSVDRDPAAHVPRGQPRRPGRADQQPGHHRRRRRQAPARHRADPRDLPLRRRGGLHRRREVSRHRAVRRPLRAGPHQQPGSATAATRAPTPGRRRTAATGR